MYIETERLIITEFTMDMAQTVQENSVDEDNRRFVPDEVWETVEEAEKEAKVRGCKYSFLNTFGFQTPKFYAKYGAGCNIKGQK